MNILFKEIKGHSDLYRVSENGDVMNIKTNKILNPFIASNGYKRIELNGGIAKKYFVHRIVATVFIGEIKEGMQINHIDGNKLNNNYKNLEIVTPSENIKHSFKLGMSKVRKGAGCNLSKLKDDQIIEIRNSTLKTKELCIRYEVSDRCIQRIKNGTRWSHIK